MKKPDIYEDPIIFKYPGCTIRVYKPILANEKRARRMIAIEKAAAALLMEEERIKRNAAIKQRGIGNQN